MEQLILIRDGREVAAIPLADAPLEVGTAAANGLRLPGTGVRPFHLVLRRRRHRWYAVARGGTIRTADGREAPEIELRPAVSVAVGAYRLAVASEQAGDASPEAPRGAADRTRPLVERSSLAGTPAVALRFVGRDGSLRQRPVDPGETIVGRSPACGVVIDDPSVSARHARLLVGTAGAILEDLASLNGCFVDGRRIYAADVSAGAALRFGAVDVQCLPRRDEAAARLGGPGPVFPAGLRRTLEAARIAAALREPCLLLGETGSGKEVLARHVHAQGPRRSGPFVPVNCAALPRDLAESILFGHRRGAFTGAVEHHRGAFERAAGGTLFLDEVGEAPLEIQAKLLRAVEEAEVLPVGAEKPVDVDVRVVAATHRDLLAAARAGRFRIDLWHRLSVVVVRVPPLRERPGDIAPLSEALLEAAAAQVGVRRLDAGALEALRQHSWPGNVRELRNVLLRAAAWSDGPAIGRREILAALDGAPAQAPDALDAGDAEELLVRHGGSVTAAARAAGLPRSTFRDWLARCRARTDCARTRQGRLDERIDAPGAG
jgi:hypothetical protein